jgi:hypothetical protein
MLVIVAVFVVCWLGWTNYEQPSALWHWVLSHWRMSIIPIGAGKRGRQTGLIPGKFSFERTVLSIIGERLPTMFNILLVYRSV